MRLIISGSRSIPTGVALLIVSRMIEVHAWRPVEIVSGGCYTGPDQAAEAWARHHRVTCRVMPAHWTVLGKRAGPERNARMVEVGTHLLALWDNASTGTGGIIEMARRRGLPTSVLEVLPSPATALRLDEERRAKAREKRQRPPAARAA